VAQFFLQEDNMVVIYAEKASLAKAIAHALGAGQRIAGSEKTIGHWEFSFYGEAAVLCHGAGHLATLLDARDYDTERYGKWDLDNYPCIPTEFRVKPIPKKASPQAETCLKYIKPFFERADWLINATDPDREGETIFAYVYDLLQSKKPWKRA
jgi:DNA topoisomerase-3